MRYDIYKLTKSDEPEELPIHSEKDIRDAIDYVARLEHPDDYCIKIITDRKEN